MRIQTSDIIVGQPALAIRKLLQYRDGTISTIAESLHLDYAAAKQVLYDLSSEGYITVVETADTQEKPLEWYNTTKGNALANATARKAITRRKAEQILTAFLERVKEINACNDYAYRVTRVIVFGSYLSDTPTLGDIDLSILLELRYSDSSTFAEIWQERIMHAIRHGKHFRNISEEQSWPQLEIHKILKGHSPSISLHDETREQTLVKYTPSKIIFDEHIEKN